MFSTESLGLVLTSIVSLVVGLMAHRVQVVTSKDNRKSARELAETESLNSMISTLRAELREARQVSVDLRELYHKSTLENQNLQHGHAQVTYRLEKAQNKLVELQKEVLSLKEERAELVSEVADTRAAEETTD